MVAALGLLGGALGLSKFLGGGKMRREAQKNIDNFRWKELNNVGEDLSVSTLGADLQREEASRALATSVDAIQAGGVRAFGALGRVNAQNQNLNRRIGADLDQQQRQNDLFRAQDEARIRSMEERRQANELSGYGKMLDVGRAQEQQGLSNIFSGVASAFTLGMGTGKAGVKPTVGATQSTPITGFTGTNSGFGQYPIFEDIKF